MGGAEGVALIWTFGGRSRWYSDVPHCTSASDAGFTGGCWISSGCRYAGALGGFCWGGGWGGAAGGGVFFLSPKISSNAERERVERRLGCTPGPRVALMREDRSILKDAGRRKLKKTKKRKNSFPAVLRPGRWDESGNWRGKTVLRTPRTHNSQQMFPFVRLSRVLAVWCGMAGVWAQNSYFCVEKTTQEACSVAVSRSFEIMHARTVHFGEKSVQMRRENMHFM